MTTSLVLARRLSTAVAFALGALLVVPASAQAPALIPVQGVLETVDGQPVDGEVTLGLAVFREDLGGDAVYEESQVIMARAGAFVAFMGDVDPVPLELFRESGNAWIEIRVEGEPLLPRLRLGSVPYAAYAEFAGNVAGGITSVSAGAGLAGGGAEGDVSLAVDPNFVQRRVTGTPCPAGQALVEIGEDGSAVCAPTGVTTVSAGAGLVGGGTGAVSLAVNTGFVQRRVRACPAGQTIRSVAEDGTVTCLAPPALDCVTVSESASVNAGAFWSQSPDCASGYQATGGGWNFSGAATDVWPWQIGAATSDTTAFCRGTNRSAGTITSTCYVRCCRLD